MAASPKRPRNAAPLADLVGKTVGDAFARQGFAAVEIVTHWQEIVGDDLAKRSEPIKLAWPRRDDPDSVGVLQIRVEGAYALEIQHLQPVIVERVNRYFGWRCVGRLAIRQGPVASRRKRPAPRKEPTAEEVGKARQAIGKFEDDALAHSVARLGALIKDRGRK
ncbi:MAG: DciA family protein [Xanthobacteraceae bacterium]|nr:DciA family protein [Xanthobacteraceae bacterium]